MKDATKIAIGAGAAALLGWAAHGPFGMGASFVEMLQRNAQTALTGGGIHDVSVTFPTTPLSRVAILDGTPREIDRLGATAMVNAIPGVSFARWAGKEAPAVSADLPEATSPDAPVNTAAPAVPAASPQAVQCQSGIDKVVNGRTLHFRSGSAWLNPESRRIIADVAATLKGCAGLAIEVAGHTDGKGDEAINRLLSDERAKRVRDELVEQGAPAASVSAKGYGSARPLRTGDRLNPSNRRISFTVVKGGA